jgi:hypothetical protein
VPRSLLLRTLLFVGVALGVAVVLATLRGGAGAEGDPRVSALLEHAALLRAAADSCRAELEAEESAFHAFDAQVDSLRRSVRDRETAAGARRTVPAAEYDDYLELFEAYNASVDAWHARADTLRHRWAVCRQLSASHNAVMEEAAMLHYRTSPEVLRPPGR